jgi:hypothetical protein
MRRFHPDGDHGTEISSGDLYGPVITMVGYIDVPNSHWLVDENRGV